MPTKSNNSNNNDNQIISIYVGTVKVDYGAIIYPNMKNEIHDDKLKEIIVSIPIQLSSFNSNYLPTHYLDDIHNISNLNYYTSSTKDCIFIQLLLNENKEIVLFFIYPPYILLLRLFLNKYKSYLLNIKSLDWQLEQLLNIIIYINNNNNNVNVNNLFFSKNILLTKKRHYYETPRETFQKT